MKVNLLSSGDREISLRVSDATPGFLNMVRRYISSNVPTLAIEKVEIVENSSGLFNEVLVHRLGLVPFTFDPEVDFSQELVAIVEKQGPCEVTANDLKTTSETVKPLYPEMPIMSLLEGQNLKLTAYMKVGRGREHAKWQGGIMGYRPMAKVKILKKSKQLMELLPEELRDLEEGSSKTVEMTNILSYAEEKFPDQIEVKPSHRDFVVEIESTSGYSADSLIKYAVKAIEEDLDRIEKSL